MGLAVLARRGGALGAAFVLVAVAMLLWTAPASADIEFCPLGEGAGQCGAALGIGSQRGLAVDTETGRLYVADEANNRINVFAADGSFIFGFGFGVADGTTNAPQTCTTTCFKGIAGEGAGQLDQPTTVAVDNDPASSSRHAVYVADSGNLRVQRFDPSGEFVWTVGKGVDKTDGGDLCTQAEGNTCGKGASSATGGGFASDILLAVGPGGVLYAVDSIRDFLSSDPELSKWRLQRFEPSGAPIPPQAILFEEDRVLPLAIAVDAAGNLWVSGEGEGDLRKYSPAGSPLVGPFPTPAEPRARFSRGLAIDAAGNIYAAQSESGDKGSGFNVITAFDPAGKVFRRFAYTASGGGGFGNSLNGLAAHTSAFGEIFFSQSSVGINYVFQPPPGPVPAPPSLEVEALGSAKATLVAEVNPEGKAPTTVHFEYLTQAAYEAQGNSFAGAAKTSPTPLSIPAGREFNLNAAEAQIGCPDPASEAGKPGSKCLTPETTYRWRVVAANADGEGTAESSFTTKESPELGEIYATRVGTDTARLNAEVNPNSIPATGFFEYVDDAAYQKDIGEGGDGFAAAVKAPDVDEGQAPLDFGAGEGFTTRQVAIYPLDPGAVYHYRLVADNPLVEAVQSPAEELRTFEPPEIENCPGNQASRIGPGALLPDCRAYEMVSPLDKAGGDIRVLETTVAKLAVLEQSSDSGERLAYGSVRSFGGAASAPFTSQYIARRIAGEEWRTHSINPPRGRPIFSAIQQTDTEFKAFSADLCDAWLTSFAEPPLGEGALAGYSNLYRRRDELCSEDGKARYEALAPIAKPASIPPGSGFLLELLGVSADGEHAAFVANDKLSPQGGNGQRQLYEHVRGEGLRLACVLPAGGAVSGSCTAGSVTAADPGAQIGKISSDGERVFWSTPGGGEGQIYVRIGGTQTVAVSKAGEEESETSGSWFWGAAMDGSKAIFSTSSEPGVSDLYEFEVDTKQTEPIAEGVRGVMGISEDADRVYFASEKALAAGAVEGQANLYLHEAGGDSEFIATLANADLTEAVSSEPYRRHTSRVSPDGGHAVFVSAASLTGYDNKGGQNGVATEEIYRYDAAADELLCVSCNPSGARPEGRSRIPAWQTGTHAARVLSEDGSRLYFDSADALAAHDTNGQTDVYQWEEPGAGGCDEAEATFSPAAGGCVELISSGQSPLNSRFVESSPSGEDAFFATGASLLPQDFGGVDIYDARLGGGLPIPPAPKPPCEGDACHAQIPVPEEPTPASSDYVAPTVRKAARRRCAKGKRRVSRKGKSRCVPKGESKRRRAGR